MAAEVGAGDDRRRARTIVDQRDLAEPVPRPQRPHDLPLDADRRIALLDDEEADAALTLFGDRVALREAALRHLRGELLEVLALAAREQRHPAEALGNVGHRTG